MTGWGTGSWGTSSWGLGLDPALTFVGAVASSIRTVEVTLSRAPLAVSPILPGDALNPQTWTVERLDTEAELLVVGVSRIGPETFELLLLDLLGPYLSMHRVSADGLLDPIGGLVDAPRSFDFAGVIAVALSPAPESTQDLRSAFDTGTLAVEVSGDYALHAGADLLRKLIIRRLTTMTGGFFHMPDYGLGMRVKEPLTTTDLVRLKGEIERQVLEEPEVAAVRAAVSLGSNGVLMLSLRARLRASNQEITVPMEIPTFTI